jgi:hypothetical protein
MVELQCYGLLKTGTKPSLNYRGTRCRGRFEGYESRTLLWWAVSGNHQIMVKSLLEKGAEVDSKNMK